jgi:hypothetical protein
LIAALARAGASYYSDRYVVLDSDGRVHQYARPLWLRAGAGSNAVRYRPEELGARTGTQSLAIGTVVFVRHQNGSRAHLLALTRPEAISQMMSAACVESHPETAQSVIAKVLADALVLEGVRGEAAELLELLLGPGRRSRES